MSKKIWVPGTVLWWVVSAAVVTAAMHLSRVIEPADTDRATAAVLAGSVAAVLLAVCTLRALTRSVRAAGLPRPRLRAATVTMLVLTAVLLAAQFAPAFTTGSWPLLAAGPALVFAALAGAAHTRAAALVAPVAAAAILGALAWPLQAWAVWSQFRVDEERDRPLEAAASAAGVRAAEFPIYTSPAGGSVTVFSEDDSPTGPTAVVHTNDFGLVATFTERRDCAPARAGDPSLQDEGVRCRRVSDRVSVSEARWREPDGAQGVEQVNSRIYVQMPTGVTVLVFGDWPNVPLADETVLALVDQLRVVDPDTYTAAEAEAYLLMNG